MLNIVYERPGENWHWKCTRIQLAADRHKTAADGEHNCRCMVEKRLPPTCHIAAVARRVSAADNGRNAVVSSITDTKKSNFAADPVEDAVSGMLRRCSPRIKRRQRIPEHESII
jgi:hypothetical protein